MKSKIIYLFFLLIFFFVSCSSPTDPMENAFSFESLDSQLMIKNNSNKTIYLFVVQRGTAAGINWAPHFNDPKVHKNDSILIDFKDIFYGDKTVKSGDEVIVNYWDDSNKANPKVYSIVIVL